MKCNVLSFFFMLGVYFSSFAQLQWNDPVNLSNEYGPSREQNITSDGQQLYLVWNQWGDLMFRRSENGGTNWGNKITLYSGFDYGANYPVAAASQGKVYVAYYRNTSGNAQIFMVRSTNNGQSFGNEIQVTNAIRGAQVPQIVASGDTVAIAYEDRDINYKYQIFVTLSTDAGLTWSTPVQLTNTAAGARWCTIAIKNQSLFVWWNDQTGANYDHLDLFFSKSDDFGMSWSSAVNLSNNQAYNARLSAQVLDNSLYVAVSSKIDGLQTDIMLYRSDDLGNNWNAPLNLSANTGASERPGLWVARNALNHHRIYVVWSDDTYSANDRAFLKYSTDHGSNWSEMIQFSQNTEDASWPQLVSWQTANTENFYAVWYRPNDGTFNYEVWGRSASYPLSEMVNLSGFVSSNGQAVVAAAVSLGNSVSYTNELGFYSLDVPAGTYDFQVIAAAYVPYVIPDLEINQTQQINVELEPLEAGLYPPHLLDVSLVGLNNVFVQWQPPIGFNSFELAWDDGEANGFFTPEIPSENTWIAVAFEPQSTAVVRQLKLFTSPNVPQAQIQLYVLADNNGNPDVNQVLGGPFEVTVSTAWTTFPVDIPVTGGSRFYIACHWPAQPTFSLGMDLNQPDGFSYLSTNNGSSWTAQSSVDMMVRAGLAEPGKNMTDHRNALEGYLVFIDGIKVGETSLNNQLLSDLEPGNTYEIGVKAVYPDGESPMATEIIELPLPLLFPPINLTAEVLSENHLELNWDAPASSGSWLQWDNGVNTDAVGGSNIQIFDAAVRFEADDLTALHGQYLTHIAAYIADADCQIFIRVWQGGNQYYAGNLVREQLLAYPIANSWNEVNLETPLQIDASQELWFGYRIINTSGGFPAGTDNGPAVPYKGDMLLYGSDWVSMSDYFGWNINWNIKGMVVDAGQPTAFSQLIIPEKQEFSNFGLPKLAGKATASAVFGRMFTHYNVYRDHEKVAEVPSDLLSYQEDLTLSGGGNYFVTSAWGDFESAASNEVFVDWVKVIETSESWKMHLYPNPGKPDQTVLQLSLKAGSSALIQLIDVRAQLLQTRLVDFAAGITQLKIHGIFDVDLKPGLYFIKVQGVDYNATLQWMVVSD